MPSAKTSANTAFTILGSGFGLYGYLPALIESGVEVVLPVRYQSTLIGRLELSQYLPKVTWCADVETALTEVGGAVVALRPIDQAAWIPRLAAASNIQQVILEKPVAPDPTLAAFLLDALEQAGKRYRVGYTFRLMPWADHLRTALTNSPDGICLEWSFLAHHYRTDRSNWKRCSPTGGGALRFFGIHAIALLAELGYDDVFASTTWGPSDTETQRWEATFIGRGLCPFALKIDSRAKVTSFKIAARIGKRARMLVDQADPFSSFNSKYFTGQDLRVGVLQRLYQSFDEPDGLYTQSQKSIVALWARAEEKSRRA